MDTTDEQADPAPRNDLMADLLSQEEYAFQQPQRGDIRKGTVVWMGPNEIVVDIGVKREGIITSRDLERLSPEELAEIDVGSEITVYVVKPEDEEGNLIASIYLARMEKAWVEAQDILESGDVVETEVSGYNKGGLVVPFENLRGFVPASHVLGLPRRMSEDERLERLAAQVGREIRLQVIEVDRKRKRLVMSETSAVRAWREQQREHLLETLEEGQTIHGVVRSLANFGAFVDLGGVDGLVHISELSWQPVRHPSQVVHVGEELDVYVLNLNKEEGKIGLSLRRLRPDPWTMVDTWYHVGQRVEGVVTNVVDFGAFVRLEEGIEGLVHISEISDEGVEHPGEVLSKDQRCLLEIIKIDPDRRRVGLSLKRVPVEEQVSWANANETRPAVPGSAAPPLSEPELPDAEASDVDVPDADVPEADAPAVDVPEVEVSGADAPEIDVPDADASAVDVPEVEVSGADGPDEVAPEEAGPAEMEAATPEPEDTSSAGEAQEDSSAAPE